MLSLMSNPITRMDEIVLKPHFSCGIRWQDKRSGLLSKEKSLHVSTTTTLFRMLLVLMGVFLGLRALFCISRWRYGRMLRKKYRQKRRMWLPKMSKS